MLPGLIPAVGSAGGPKIESFVEVWSFTSEWNSAFTLPATQAGDLIIMYQMAQNTGGTFQSPAGWSGLKTDTYQSYKAKWAYKVADGTEGGTQPLLMTGNGNPMEFIVCFRFNEPLTAAVMPAVRNMEFTGGNPVAQNIPFTEGAAPVFGFAIYSEDNQSGAFATSWTGSTPDYEVTIHQGDIWTYCKAQLQADTLTDVVADMADIGDYIVLMSAYLELSAG